MTQHTQPVVAAQHQQHQQQQQQQQHQTTTTPNSSNSNTSNNSNSNSTPTTSNPTTNNNQTQTVAVQQHQNNNNNSNSYQNATSGQMFNPQLQSGNVYVPTHGMPAHHHPQHHHQPGAMYQTMIPAAIPSNVFVNNVTANVNLHGWAHTVPHGAWVHPGSVPQYIPGELPPEQGATVIQPMGAMPVTLPAPNALAGPVMNPNPTILTGGTGRGRGRGGASASKRSDYNMQRHPPSEGSSAPQQAGQNYQQDMQQQQQGQQTSDAQQMMTTIQPSYVPHPQYAAHAQYPYGYPTYFSPPQHMIHPGQSAAAQQATGTPLYFSAMPVYNGPHMYNYGYYLPPVINQPEYPFGEEVGVGDERQATGDGSMIWHQQPMYADEYGLSSADMHAVSSDDMNHNASSMGSVNETPSLLSPNYPPMYEQMTQQMGVMQIYDDPQMGQMEVMHPQGGVLQMEDELSECGSQPSTSMQMVPPIQMVPAAPPMTLPAASNEQILQQQTPHLIPVSGAAIMPIDDSITPNATPQHQIQQQQQFLIRDNSSESNIQTYEHVQQIQSGESVTSLNEEIVQPQADNLAAVDYQQQSPQQQQQQQVQTQNVLVEAVQMDNYCSSKIIMTDVQELQESSSKTSKSTMATVPAVTTSTDVAIETVATNIQQCPQTVLQQQESPEKAHRRHPAQQYVAKQSVPQQQYQHQQLQTQPMQPAAQQQQQTVQPQPQQQSHYQTSNQQQHQHHHQHQQQQQHHQPQQQSYENRKSSQMYNQQHQSRNRKYDYHHNDGSSHQQQQQSQQTTKSMSWTNSSQHKKSTNTVGVTATPTSSHTSGNYNKSSNTTNSSTTHTHATRTYTNQQHHNYQQQNYHYQQQQHQPATRNHAAMKMPSSPISSGSNTNERKTSQSSDAGKGHTTQQQHPQQQQQSTSTASTTAAPHQFQQQQSQQTSTNDMVQTPTSTTSTVSIAATTISSKQQQSQHYPPGFATKKHSLSNQGRSSSSSATNTATATTTNSAVESSNTPAINLAPPVSATTPAAPSTPSWASLFASSSNAGSTNTSNTAALSSSLTTSSNSSTTSAAYSKKPIAKVAPYEGITPVTPPPPVVTPGALSYSAASAQNLPPPAANTAAAKKNATSNEQQSQRNSLTNLDEYSLKFAEFLTKYKSDWATISLRPRGLTNRSNYCYINSILQALLGCSPLYNLIRSIPKQAANFCEVKTPTVNAMITFMSNFSNLPSGLRLRNTKGGKGNKDDLGGDLQCDPAFEPTEIYKLWNDSREEHVEGRQEDAEEFLSYILNKLNDEMLEVIKLITKPNMEQNEQNEPPEEDGDVWQMICNNRNKGSVTRQTDFGCTPLSDIFRGELRSRLQREGEHSTDVIQPFFTLQLNIEKAASVKEALEILVGRDQLEGVTGSKSKQEVVAWQQMNLEKLPPILILHLKWFDYRSDGCTKILKKVEFPVELKIDTKILASKNYSQKKRAYRLFAVVYHDGKEATKGHYITDVYHTGYGSWLRYDDSSVKPVSENHVLLPRTPRVPYLLCYRRCDTIPQQSNNNQNNSSSGNNNSSGNTQSLSGK